MTETLANRAQLNERLGLAEAAQAANGRQLLRDLDGRWWLADEHPRQQWLLRSADDWE